MLGEYVYEAPSEYRRIAETHDRPTRKEAHVLRTVLLLWCGEGEADTKRRERRENMRLFSRLSAILVS